MYNKEKLSQDLIEAIKNYGGDDVLKSVVSVFKKGEEAKPMRHLYLKSVEEDNKMDARKPISYVEMMSYSYRVLGNLFRNADDMINVFGDAVAIVDGRQAGVSVYNTLEGIKVIIGNWVLILQAEEPDISRVPIVSIVATGHYVEGKGYPIGRDGKIPWRCMDDLHHFKEATLQTAVVMGMDTFRSLPYRPLKGRLNIVFTTKVKQAMEEFAEQIKYGNLVFINPNMKVTSPEMKWYLKTVLVNAIELLRCKKIVVMGGGRIYKLMEPYVGGIIWTKVECVVEDADTFYEPAPHFIPRSTAIMEQVPNHQNSHAFKVYNYYKPKNHEEIEDKYL